MKVILLPIKKKIDKPGQYIYHHGTKMVWSPRRKGYVWPDKPDKYLVRIINGKKVLV